MKKFVLAATVAALTVAAASAASAAVTFSFTDGPAHSPGAGYTVIDTFDFGFGITGSGYQVAATYDSNGAPPANSVPFDTSYLSVLGGGNATISFAALTSHPVTAFEFDWGSVDTYNHLVIHSSAGDITVTPPNLNFVTPANGDQHADVTNGLFMVSGDAGETFSGITLTSGTNSFEIDNLAITGVPEPTTWAMMLVGLGALGGALRSRRRTMAACA